MLGLIVVRCLTILDFELSVVLLCSHTEGVSLWQDPKCWQTALLSAYPK